MEYLTSNQGVRMPAIIYGTAWKKARTAELVERAIEHGFRGIDTACQPRHYHEPGVGEGVAACLDRGLKRADLYLQTKFTPIDGQDPARVPYDPAATLPDQVAQSFAVSLANLRTDHLDGLVLHSPLRSPAQTLEVWRAMESLVDSGGVRQIGISNCYDPDELESLYATARIKPAVVQNRFYADTGHDREIRRFCRRNRIVYQSFWTLTANRDLLSGGEIGTLASRYRRTPAQILFRYLTRIDVVPLTGTTSEAHMDDDLAIFEFTLTDDEVRRLDALF
jgi:diketogulonate reductase-like aldo/keto reductase